MGVVWMRTKRQMTLPADICEAAHLETGDPIEVEKVAGGIFLRPKKMVDAEQAWFWSERWQLMEREVDEHVKRGEVIVSDGPDEFFADLDASLK